MFNTVTYRRYFTDDGHFHWSTEVETFATEHQARAFMAELDERIAAGDTFIKPGTLHADSTGQPSRTTGYRSSVDPFQRNS